jgi:hypothetical protein
VSSRGPKARGDPENREIDRNGQSLIRLHGQQSRKPLKACKYAIDRQFVIVTVIGNEPSNEHLPRYRKANKNPARGRVGGGG